MGSKLNKHEVDAMDRAEDMNVIGQRKEEYNITTFMITMAIKQRSKIV
jgi:hypothetical protein